MNKRQETTDQLLTFKEVKKILRIGRNSLLTFLQTGFLPGFKLQGKWMVRKSDLDDFIEDQY